MPEPEATLSPDPLKQLPPHPPLTSYYQAEPDRSAYVIDLFDRSARHYNTIERGFLNSGLWYRRYLLRREGLQAGMTMLDVATGTGAVARGAVEIVGTTGRVFGVDPSSGMLTQARSEFHGPLVRGVAEHLPFADNTFDFLTMGIALRHVSDLRLAFAEYLRVLKPGGCLMVLDSHVPSSRWGYAIARMFWARVVPSVTFMLTRSRDAKLLMDYYWETIDKCLSPEIIVRAVADSGFDQSTCTIDMPGAFCVYTGRKPMRVGLSA
jgi:demethylmenaquinone methyltransferase/2-methoxy-6-polyprenyl-1,4-benzoquinol methylase